MYFISFLVRKKGRLSQNPLRERLKICLKLPVVWQEFEDIISANSQWLILKKIRLEMILTRKSVIGVANLNQFLRHERY